MGIERTPMPNGENPPNFDYCEDTDTGLVWVQCVRCGGYQLSHDQLYYDYLKSGGTPRIFRMWKTRHDLIRVIRFITEHAVCIARNREK